MLYLLTVALEAPAIVARYVAVYVVAAVALRLTGGSGASAAGWAKLALLPTLWSAAALVNPAGGGWWWQQRLGGRNPSERERVAYEDAVAEIQGATTIPLALPKGWFVVDEASCEAAVCGDTLMLSRGLLESPHLPAVLAHELGRLQGMGPRLAAALERLVLSPSKNPAKSPAKGSEASADASKETRQEGHWARRLTLALLRGGMGLSLMAPAWGAVWRDEEYEADRWAARMGMGEELARFLELERLPNDRPIPLTWLTGHTNPPAELRIERLRAKREDPR